MLLLRNLKDIKGTVSITSFFFFSKIERYQSYPPAKARLISSSPLSL